MPHQQYQADVALEIDPDTGRLAYSEVVIIGPRQVTGKALDINTPILTAHGFKPLGMVVVGDEVFHPDGHPERVTYTSDVMYGHRCYEVATTDGRSVVADADHLWTVMDRSRRTGRTWKTVRTSDLVGQPARRFKLPLQAAIKSADVDLPIDPYVLGVWLGDGSSSKAEVTSADPEVFAAIAAAGYELSYADSSHTGRAVTRGIRGLVSQLRALRVLHYKHIPELYLTAGFDQRLALLQGLMDTDGTISTRDRGAEYSSSDPALMDGFVLLARSLGFRVNRARRKVKLGANLYDTERVSYTVSTADPPLCRLPRKLARLKPPSRVARGDEPYAVAVASVIEVASRPVRCIRVNSPDGLFLAGRDLVSCHNTEFILPLMTHRCIGMAEIAGPQRVMYTAQTADAAKEKWRDVHLPRLERAPRIGGRFVPRKTTNQEAFLWTNGSIWAPGSTTGKSSGTGDTLDMGVIDEAWSRPDARTELGMRPAMLTRAWRQFLILSMIPGLSRAQPGSWPYLAGKRQVGRARVEADTRHGMAFFDYTAPDGSDPGNPNTWWSCMPGLGRTAPESAVAEDYDALDLIDFCAEYLGWAPESGPVARWTLIPKELWRGLRDPDSQIDGRPALAIEINDARNRAYIGAAGRRWDGNRHVEVVEPGSQIPLIQEGVAWAEPRLLKMIETWKPVTVVIDPRRPANSLVPVLRQRGIDVTTPNQHEIAGACARFCDATGAGTAEGVPSTERVFHLGQPELDDALAHSRRLDLTGGDFTIVGKGQSADLGALYCVILALHGHDLKGFYESPEPDIFF